MKHVAIITNIPAPYRVDFFDYLKKNIKGYKFTVIYSSKNEDNRSWEIEQEKIADSVFLESKTVKIKKRYDTKYIHIPWKVSETLKMISPDVIVGSEYNPTVLLALQYCKKNKIPFVSWTDGTLYSERNINFLQKIFRKHVISSASAYIASSTKSKEAQIFYGASEEKINVSFLTIDTEKYIRKPQGTRTGKILYVGSLIGRKGVDLLLKALTKLKSDFELYLAGSGEEKNSLEKMANELRIGEKVHFLGQLKREELLEYYQTCDLFVLPTREDCFALVILEAICAGLPVICSKYADGAYDLIEEGKNGFIIDPFDEQELSDCIEKILTDHDFRETMQKKSVEIIRKFSFENVAKGYMQAIEESLRS